MDTIGPFPFARFAAALAGPADPDDPDGIDRDLVAAVAPWVDRLCTAWYRMEVEGLGTVPSGPALLVMNHESGIATAEALGFGARWYAARGCDDTIHALAHDTMITLPGLGSFLVRTGAVRASHANADALFHRGRKVLVAPGGNLEAYRPWRDRARIRLGGHKGFVRLALRHGVPIVPVVFSGGHEGLCVLSDGSALVRTFRLHEHLRMDTWPLVLALPWGVAFGPIFHLPLPTKVRVRVLDPIPTRGAGPADDPAAIDALYAMVNDRMQEALTALYAARRWPVLG